MNNENKKKMILRIQLLQSAWFLRIRGTLFLIFTIIAITLLIMTQNVDNNNNNILSSASLPGNKSGSINVVTTNNNYNKTINTSGPTSISLPLSRRYVNGKIGYFITTDVSDSQTAIEISNNLRFKVNFAPSIALIPESSRQQGYEFLNGVRGHGAFGFQLPVASKLPIDKGYSPIVQLNFVKWNNNSTNSDNAANNNTSITVRELKSATEIIAAQKNNELTITRTNILINSPAVSIRP